MMHDFIYLLSAFTEKSFFVALLRCIINPSAFMLHLLMIWKLNIKQQTVFVLLIWVTAENVLLSSRIKTVLNWLLSSISASSAPINAHFCVCSPIR